MFSAPVDGQRGSPMGINAPVASQNPQFILNLMHWLCGLPDAAPVSSDGVARQPFPHGRRSLKQPFHVKQLTGPPVKRSAL